MACAPGSAASIIALTADTAGLTGPVSVPLALAVPVASGVM
jgi:hypothetical protein